MQFSRLIILPVLCLTLVLVGTLVLPYALFWLQILPIVGFVFLAVGSWLIVLLWYRRVPKVARLIEYASRIKAPLAFIAFDTGRTILTPILEYLGEGIVRTMAGTYKILPQFAPVKTEEILEVPAEETEQREESEETEEANTTTKAVPKESNLILFEKTYRDFITKRSILADVDLPVFFGYAGVMCLLNPEALALYEAGEMQVRTPEGKLARLTKVNPESNQASKTKSSVLINGEPYHAVKTTPTETAPNGSVKQLVQPLMLLDPKRIKDLVSRQFSVTQFNAIIRYSEELGELGRGSFLGKYALPLGILVLVIVVALVFLLMAPQLGEVFGP